VDAGPEPGLRWDGLRRQEPFLGERAAFFVGAGLAAAEAVPSGRPFRACAGQISSGPTEALACARAQQPTDAGAPLDTSPFVHADDCAVPAPLRNRPAFVATSQTRRRIAALDGVREGRGLFLQGQLARKCQGRQAARAHRTPGEKILHHEPKSGAISKTTPRPRVGCRPCRVQACSGGALMHEPLLTIEPAFLPTLPHCHH